MNDLLEIEKETLYKIKEFSDTYKAYQDVFQDEKMDSVRSNVIRPISRLGKELLDVFDELNPIIEEAKEKMIIDE